MLRLSIVFVTLCIMLAPAASMGKDAKKASNISPLEAWQMLSQEPKTTFLVDVRTRAEYALLGHPPMAYNVPWRFMTNDFQVKDGPYQDGKASHTGYQLSAKANPDFVNVVKSLFKPEDRLLIVSTQGDLGADAADALFADGFKNVFNIRDGFSGQKLTAKDQDELAEKYSPYFGRRGRVNGWLYWGLPVSFEVNPRYVYPPDLKKIQ
jgi:rhodanese-related sulfurtransferase